MLGPGTGRWPGLDAWFLPLGEKGHVAGAACVRPVPAADEAGREHAQALCALLGQALWRLRLNADMLQAQGEAHHQQLQSTFLAAISHDLRTPLTGVTSAIEAIQTEHPDAATLPLARTELAKLRPAASVLTWISMGRSSVWTRRSPSTMNLPTCSRNLSTCASVRSFILTDGVTPAAAQMARRVTRAAGALLIVNDRLDVALAADADGVHLGQDDLPLAAAIHALGAARARMLVGISTHDLAQVAAAVAGGADYLGFGPVFPTATKANPDPVVGLDGLRAACARAGQVPVVAIGGVGVAAASALHAAGAAAACAISAVNGAADRAAAAQALALPWRTPPE